MRVDWCEEILGKGREGIHMEWIVCDCDDSIYFGQVLSLHSGVKITLKHGLQCSTEELPEGPSQAPMFDLLWKCGCGTDQSLIPAPDSLISIRVTFPPCSYPIHTRVSDLMFVFPVQRYLSFAPRLFICS